MDPEPIPVQDPNENTLHRPQSIVYRIFHGTHFLLGGLLFIAGSCMYFADVIKNNSWALEAGAWLYIAGSIGFLLADLQDWWYYRIGCLFDWKYDEAFETYNAKLFKNSRNTLLGRLERAEIGFNCFLSIIGSTFYVVGSVYFLPSLSDKAIVGDALFIIGSAVIYISQGWKVYRLACTNHNDRYDKKFRLKNLLDNILSVMIDTSAGLGGVFYFIGTILFLPQFNTTDSGENRAGGLFLCGGVFFSLAGILLQYHYYCNRHK